VQASICPSISQLHCWHSQDAPSGFPTQPISTPQNTSESENRRQPPARQTPTEVQGAALSEAHNAVVGQDGSSGVGWGVPGGDAVVPGGDAVVPGAVVPGGDSVVPGGDAVVPGGDSVVPGAVVAGPAVVCGIVVENINVGIGVGAT
jgi:hypothetical protein